MQRVQRAARLAAFSLLFTIAAFSASRDFWHELMLGNAHFIHGKLLYQHLDTQRQEHAEHQYPPVTVLSCADSRVPPELIFDHSIGDLFVVRVAGNVVDEFALASIEYAIVKGYTKLIVVMGHERCGAVEAAIDGTKLPSDALNNLVARISKNIGAAPPPLEEAIKKNAKASAQDLLDRSAIIRDAVKEHKLRIVTAYYSFDGRVTKID